MSREGSLKKAGAPASEPTFAMIVAGVAALNAHTSEERRVLPDEEIVEIIWKAMACAGLGHNNQAKKRT